MKEIVETPPSILNVQSQVKPLSNNKTQLHACLVQFTEDEYLQFIYRVSQEFPVR